MEKIFSKLAPRKSLNSIRPSIQGDTTPIQQRKPSILDFSVKTYCASVKVEEVTS